MKKVSEVTQRVKREGSRLIQNERRERKVKRIINEKRARLRGRRQSLNNHLKGNYKKPQNGSKVDKKYNVFSYKNYLKITINQIIKGSRKLICNLTIKLVTYIIQFVYISKSILSYLLEKIPKKRCNTAR